MTILNYKMMIVTELLTFKEYFKKDAFSKYFTTFSFI